MGFEHFEVRSAHNDPTPAALYEEIAPAKRFVGDLIRVVQPSVASDYAGLGHGYSANRMPCMVERHSGFGSGTGMLLGKRRNSSGISADKPKAIGENPACFCIHCQTMRGAFLGVPRQQKGTVISGNNP